MFYLGKVIGKSNKASQQVKYEEEKDIRLKQTNKKMTNNQERLPKHIKQILRLIKLTIYYKYIFKMLMVVGI